MDRSEKQQILRGLPQAPASLSSNLFSAPAASAAFQSPGKMYVRNSSGVAGAVARFPDGATPAVPRGERRDERAMSEETSQINRGSPLSEKETRAHTPGEIEPVSGRIRIVDYNPQWPEIFRREAGRIGAVLGHRALRIEHTGSTSVPGLAAKPVIDMLLVVADSADEAAYLPALESIGYVLRIREADWHEHRMLNPKDAEANLHVLSSGCPEIDRILLFRDWLRTNSADRDLYARTKLALAQQEWKYVQNYADAKTAVVEEILGRALRK